MSFDDKARLWYVNELSRINEELIASFTGFLCKYIHSELDDEASDMKHLGRDGRGPDAAGKTTPIEISDQARATLEKDVK